MKIINSFQKKMYMLTCALVNLSAVFSMEIRNSEPRLHQLIKQRAPLVEIQKAVCARSINEEYNYETPLTRAIETGDLKLVFFLYKRGALIEYEPKGRRLTPLKKAVDCQNLPMVILFKELGVRIDRPDSFYKETALYMAVSKAIIPIWDRKQLLFIIRYLVRNGADCHKACCRGLTPYQQAYLVNDKEILAILEGNS